MNNLYKKDILTGVILPEKIDSFNKTTDGYMIEYDGWHFEGDSQQNVINSILEYIFVGGEE